MAWQPSAIFQVAGLILSTFGWVSSCVTTLVPLWKNRNLDLNELEIWNMGLWHVCVIQDESIMECKSHSSLLSLPLELKISRIIMVSSNGLGFLAFSFSIWGMNCLKTSYRNLELKKRFGIAGGTLFCVSGMATLVPVSWVAYITVQEFWDETLPDIMPRWEFGEALFLGWFAGFFLILGGLFIICSACSLKVNTSHVQLAVHQKPGAKELQTPPRLLTRHPYPAPKNSDLVI